MKKMKRIVSLLLTVVMVMAMTVVASAADITISKGDKNIADGHTYEAYQIFKGTLTADGKTLTEIEWGSGVNGADLLIEIAKEGSPYANCETAEDVADVLKGFENDSAELDSFATAVSKYLDQKAGSSDGEGKIENLPNGYYFVKDTTKNLSTDEPDAFSKFIVRLAGENVAVTVKADAPSITKKIVDGEKRVDQNTASIGDEVTYELKSKVPDMDGYNKYYFIMNDTLSSGLDYDGISSIYIGGQELKPDTDYTVDVKAPNEGEVGETKVKIVFKNFISHAALQGQDVVVTMKATVNNNAVIGTTGNPNTVNLEYSNNPNVDYAGDDEPVGEEVIGKTPDDTVITYLTGIQITKKDDETGAPLAGAEFEIKGTSLNVVKVTKEAYVEDTTEEAKYYKLKDGTYTDVAPSETTQDSYEEGNKKYKLTETTTYEKTKEQDVNMTVTTDSAGVIKFDGLGAGTYIITEVAAPDGYNKLAEPITVTVKAYETDSENIDHELTFVGDVVSSGNDQIKWTSALNGQIEREETEEQTGKVAFDIGNKQGAVLPSTGGIGTTIFYVLGAILVIGAGLVLVTKKRMGAEK